MNETRKIMMATQIPLPIESSEANNTPVSPKAPVRNYNPKLKIANRAQLNLRVTSLEDLIPPDHLARSIWDFVGSFDLQLFYDDINSVNGEPGGPSTDPQTLISVWLYAYTQGISSSREVSRLIDQLHAFQWLTADTSINYHTLSDFRVKNKEALDNLFSQILAVLHADGLITLEQTAHDGTKIKTHAAGNSFHREETLEKSLELAKIRIKELENPESQGITSERVRAAQERAAKEKLARLEKARDELKEIQSKKEDEKSKASARVSFSEPESRTMKQADGGFAPCYNVQLTTDTKSGAIVGAGVVQSGNDSAELSESMKRVKQQAGEFPKQVLVDGGYTNRATIIAMKDMEIDMIGSVPETSESNFNKKAAPEFQAKAFKYNSEKNEYVCFAGKILRYSHSQNEVGATTARYIASFEDCKICPFKEKCCPENKKAGRGISRLTESPDVIAFKEKMKTEEAKKTYKKRGPAAEFSNAWLKEKFNLRKFQLTGLIKAQMEILWACIAYNMQLWIRLIGREKHVVA